MPKKINSHGKDQEYVPAGNGDASGEYADEGGSNYHFTNSDFGKPDQYNFEVFGEKPPKAPSGANGGGNDGNGIDKKPPKSDNKKRLAVPEGEDLRARILADVNDKMTIKEIVNDPVIKKAAEKYAYSEDEETANIDTPERWQIRKDAANKINQSGSFNPIKDANGKTIKKFDGKVDKGYRAEIVIGVPAGGKSSVIVNKVSQNTNSRVLDSDDIKALLPEFDGGNGAGKVHKESADIILNKLVVPEYYKGGSHAGDNIVIPIVGKSDKAAKMYLENLKKAGYTVHLSFNDVTPLNSAKRATTRYIEEGRFLSPIYIESVGVQPQETYKSLKKEGGFDTYSKYDNNVKMGEKAKKIERLDSKGNPIKWEDWQ